MLSTLFFVACNNSTLQSNWSTPLCKYIHGEQFMIVETMGDYIRYEYLDELVSDSTAILRVEILDIQIDVIDTVLPRDYVIDRIEEYYSSEEIYYFFGGCLEWLNFDPQYEIATIYTAVVLEVFQGHYYTGEKVVIRQTGGRLGNLEFENDDFLHFSIGDDVILFMQSWSHLGLPNVLMNPSQSAYYTPAIYERALADIKGAEAYIKLESVSYGNNISVTIENLVEIYERNQNRIYDYVQ